MRFPLGQPTYVIAEIGANHNGDMDLAHKMIDTAKGCGADAVKFQSWDTSIFSAKVYDDNFFLGDDYRQREDYTLKEIVDEFAVTPDQMAELRDYCATVDIDFASTPFDLAQLQQQIDLDSAFIKIASMDVNNHRLLKAAGASGRPIILSTGFATLDEIDQAVRLIEDAGNQDIAILHCISLYPPEDGEVNLDNMEMLRQAFGYPIGFSDHTLGIEISLAAIAKRAVVLEKHFTLDKEMFGWDHKMSCTPEELAAICTARDRIHAALGSSRRSVGARELERRSDYRRSVVAARHIRAGDVVGEADIDFRRPGTGIAPTHAELIVGQVAARDILADTMIRFEDLQ